MKSNKELKNRLTFTGNMILKEQSFEGNRESYSRTMVDRLSEELKQKESVISFLNMHNSEWKAKSEELVKENSMLRAKLSQVYGENMSLVHQKHQDEIGRYVSSELYLKQETSKLENKLKSIINENSDLVLKNSNLSDEITLLKDQLKSQHPKIKKQNTQNCKLQTLKSQLESVKSTFKALLKTKDSLESLENLCNFSLTSLKSQATLNENSLKLEKSRLEVSLQIRSQELSSLSSDLHSKSVQIKELEDQNLSLTKSLSSLTSNYNLLEKEYLRTNPVISEKSNQNNLKKLKQDLQESNEKNNYLENSQKLLMDQIQNSVLSTLKVLHIPPHHISPEEVFKTFPVINNTILQLFDKTSAQSLKIQENEEKISELLEKISKLESKNDFFALTQKHDLEQEVDRLTIEINSLSSQLEEKDMKIKTSTIKIQRLQEEIKSSFEKIDSLKHQLSQSSHFQNLANHLQDSLSFETASKNHLESEIQKLQKKIKDLENRNSKPADPHFFLLQKIESMKTELENFCPSENKSFQDRQQKTRLVTSLSTPVNKMVFTLKMIEEDLSCKSCLKIEDCDFCTSGHFSCSKCFSSCKTCQGTYLSSSLFFRLSRRLRDLSLSSKEASELLTVFT
jgi:chromosome segregation ATPase